MKSIFETLPQLTEYKTALLVLGALCLIALIQNFLTAPLAFVKEEQVPGMPLKGDHSLLSFRVLRTYANTVESFPAFGWALFLAIIVGVAPWLVNWLAGIYLAFRLAFWACYYSGIGKIAGGPRTMTFVGCLLSNLILAGTAIYTLLTI